MAPLPKTKFFDPEVIRVTVGTVAAFTGLESVAEALGAGDDDGQAQTP
jgi:hypothetical protein